MTIGCLEATRIFPGVSCQIFSVEIDGSGFPNDKAVEDSNRLAHDIMYLFNRKGLVIVPTAFILQKAGRFIRRKLLTTDFEKPRSDCVFATQSFNDERLPVEPESKMRIPVIRLP